MPKKKLPADRPVLDFLDPGGRAVVEPLMEPLALDGGDDLYRIGEPANGVYVIVSGLLSVRQLNGYDQQGQAVALLSSGAPVGEAALVGIKLRNSTLTAVQDSRLLMLSLDGFSRLKKQHPGVAIDLLEFFLSKTSVRLQRCSARLSRIL